MRLNDSNQPSADQVMTVAELAKTLRIGRNQAYQLATSEDFPSIRIGRQLRISKSAFVDWLRRKSDEPV